MQNLLDQQQRLALQDKKLFAGIWSKGEIPLKKNTIFGRSKTESFVCNTCEVITIDLKTQKA